MTQNIINLVWYKRDLRVLDHAALAQACERGNVLPLYIAEPDILTAPDADTIHWSFIRESLTDLRHNLAERGGTLYVRQGEAVAVLESLRHTVVEQGYDLHIWAHEETGNGLTFARDLAVIRWAKNQGVQLTEIPANGVVRRLANRDQWAGLYAGYINAAFVKAPTVIPPLPEELENILEEGQLPTHAGLGIVERALADAQSGGEREAHAVMRSFLNERGINYRREMSSPVTAYSACSRLSPHIAYGTMSARVAQHLAERHRRQVLQMPLAERERFGTDWPKMLDAFTSRLRWRSHFMQKLETEPRIEFENFVTTYDGMRPDDGGELYEAWAAGQSGYPLVDACMRALASMGWLNFRMRAMLVTFVTFDLWHHWRRPSLHLARLFVDYEPGIHYCQHQMQGGTTGVDTVRIYSPIKQSEEQDPQGIFIRRWVPELEGVPDVYVHTPWLMPGGLQAKLNVRIGQSYPKPIVDHEVAMRIARQRLAKVRNLPETQTQAHRIRVMHSSQRPAHGKESSIQRAKKKAQSEENQPSLFEIES